MSALDLSPLLDVFFPTDCFITVMDIDDGLLLPLLDFFLVLLFVVCLWMFFAANPDASLSFPLCWPLCIDGGSSSALNNGSLAPWVMPPSLWADANDVRRSLLILLLSFYMICRRVINVRIGSTSGINWNALSAAHRKSCGRMIRRT